jgi:ribosomal-protein-alanine N-acetyltransferase
MASSIGEAREFFLARMSEHDLLEVVEIEENSGLSRWGWDAYHAELARESSSIMLVMRARNEDGLSTTQSVKGFIAARIIGDEVHVNNVAVREQYRRHGVAKRLLEAVLAEALRMGARTAILEVRVSNAPAQALYAGCGFKVIGRRPGYYTQPLEDALVMSLAIRT